MRRIHQECAVRSICKIVIGLIYVVSSCLRSKYGKSHAEVCYLVAHDLLDVALVCCGEVDKLRSLEKVDKLHFLFSDGHVEPRIFRCYNG